MLSRQSNEPPVVLVKWYDWTRWVLDRVDSFPKNQRFVFGQRLADHTIDVLELLVEAAYSAEKVPLLTVANRRIEMLRWLVRLAKDRKLFTPKQYEFSCLGLSECGRMVGGWLKHSQRKDGSGASAQAPVRPSLLAGQPAGGEPRCPPRQAAPQPRGGLFREPGE